MDHPEHCELLAVEIERFAALVETVSPSTPVPSCPGWTVDDVGLHLGTVHRWVEHLVRVRAAARIASSEMGLDEGPVDGEWIRLGGAALLGTLRASDPTDSMWAWGSDQHVRFWSRRQLHETLVHRFDLEIAAGRRPAAAAYVAADTIDEFLVNLAKAAYFSPKVKLLRGNGESIVLRARRIPGTRGPSGSILTGSTSSPANNGQRRACQGQRSRWRWSCTDVSPWPTPILMSQARTSSSNSGSQTPPSNRAPCRDEPTATTLTRPDQRFCARLMM